MLNILNKQQIDSFIIDGFVRIDDAFSTQIAQEARDILWQDIPADPQDPATWTRPVVWLGMYTQSAFLKAANNEGLHRIYDQLAGEGKWLPVGAMGSFPVRFPSGKDNGDTGLHVDAGFPGEDPSDFFSWRINQRSKGRALLMLFLFSDVTVNDAPTRILKGSHLDVAALLKDKGEAGLSFMELAQHLKDLPEREEVLGIGPAGTVYLCHPFMVHGAQPHHGTEPRFMAQPPLLLKSDLGFDDSKLSPVEQAIKMGLNK